MDQQFKKLLQLSKENNNPLMKTFEGAIFEGSTWFIDSETDSFEVIEREELKSQISLEQPKFEQQISASQVNISNHLCHVLFLGDSFQGEDEDLLGRMISAMKLKEGEYYRYPLDSAFENIADLSANLENPDEATKNMLDFIVEKNPAVIVSLGAIVTNILLGRREKLSSIHGQFFEKKIQGQNFNMMPIFHPDFLLINPNMKRTAWIDLQKVMERVGKN